MKTFFLNYESLFTDSANLRRFFRNGVLLLASTALTNCKPIRNDGNVSTATRPSGGAQSNFGYDGCSLESTRISAEASEVLQSLMSHDNATTPAAASEGGSEAKAKPTRACTAAEVNALVKWTERIAQEKASAPIAVIARCPAPGARFIGQRASGAFTNDPKEAVSGSWQVPGLLLPLLLAHQAAKAQAPCDNTP